MGTKAIRVFYRTSDNQIVWYHELRGPGVFPTTIREDLAEIPDKIVSREIADDGAILSETKLGGVKKDYKCVEEQDTQRASDFLASDENRVVDDKLLIGAKRIVVEPEPPMNYKAEINGLKAKVETLEKK